MRITPPVRRAPNVAALMRRLLPILAACAALLAAAPTPAPAATVPPAHHVFVIVLENHEFFDTFGPGGQVFAPYLNRTVVPMGQLLTQYYGVGHSSADNYIAMASGPPPATPPRGPPPSRRPRPARTTAPTIRATAPPTLTPGRTRPSACRATRDS